MPSYTCTTTVGRLDALQRAAIARTVTQAHHDVTGAPAYFARVGFVEVDAASVFVGGAPLDHDHLFVFGHIRAGRDDATRRALVARIADAVAEAAAVARRGVWVYLSALPPGNMMEFGRALPASGAEAEWEGSVPADDLAWMRSLAP